MSTSPDKSLTLSMCTRYVHLCQHDVSYIPSVKDHLREALSALTAAMTWQGVVDSSSKNHDAVTASLNLEDVQVRKGRKAGLVEKASTPFSFAFFDFKDYLSRVSSFWIFA